jgi:hypothetical protein
MNSWSCSSRSAIEATSTRIASRLTLPLSGGTDWCARCASATGVTGRTVRSSALLGTVASLAHLPSNPIAQLPAREGARRKR